MMHGTRGGGECVRLCRGIGHNLTARTHTNRHIPTHPHNMSTITTPPHAQPYSRKLTRARALFRTSSYCKLQYDAREPHQHYTCIAVARIQLQP